MFRALLVHHQGDFSLQHYDYENLRSRNNPFTVLLEWVNSNVIKKTTNSYMFRALLVHHQGDFSLQQYFSENLRSRNNPFVVCGLYETRK